MAPILEKFKDPLPIPKVLEPTGRKNGQLYYELIMSEFTQNLHSDLPDTRVWGFNNSFPGPTIVAHKDKPIYVRWINKLPNKHLLPLDKTIHGVKGNPEVRTVVHLHGLNVSPESDGYPESWFSHGKSALYNYPNKQEAATLWYHDHTVGITRLNVYAGLAGFYLIRDKREKFLNLPSGKYEIPLVIQDRDFDDNGQLVYPGPNNNGVEPSIVPAFFGNYALVNGKVWPHLEVEPRKYRFRLLNGSNTRNYTLRLAGKEGSNLPSINQIGTDGGFLERPAKLKSLSLFPGERADVIIDFTGLENNVYTLMNDAVPPFGTPLPEIMQFRVLDTPVKDDSRLPQKLNNIPVLNPKNAKQRDIEFTVGQDDYGRLLFMLENKSWMDPITIKVKLGSVEVWNLINPGAADHPFHVHLVQFQILNRQPFDVDEYLDTGRLKFIGPPELPDENERGWKDTVKVDIGKVTRIIARFGDYTGKYPFHCHILEHEDHDMMRQFLVYDPDEKNKKKKDDDFFYLIRDK